MRRDPATDGKSVKRTNKVVPVAISRRATENRKPNVQLPQIRRMYTVQVRVIDPEGQEILNLTKMAFEEDTNNIRYSISDMKEILEMLIEATGEWIS